MDRNPNRVVSRWLLQRHAWPSQHPGFFTIYWRTTLYLGVAVGGEELAPRLPLHSVPYAIKSGVAQNVTGDITPSSITIGGANGTVIDSSGVTVGGNVIIDASGEWSGPAPTVSFNDLLDRPFTFNDLSCSDGQIPQVVGGVWTCTPASAADTLSGLGCAEGEIPAFIGGVWTCATDADTNTTYAPRHRHHHFRRKQRHRR